MLRSGRQGVKNGGDPVSFQGAWVVEGSFDTLRDRAVTSPPPCLKLLTPPDSSNAAEILRCRPRTGSTCPRWR